MYIRNNKIKRGEWNILDRVVDYKKVRIGDLIYTLPVVERMNIKEQMQYLVMGIVGAILLYAVVVMMIVLAPCSTM